VKYCQLNVDGTPRREIVSLQTLVPDRDQKSRVTQKNKFLDFIFN
jgi:hypothetical protein